MSSVINVPFEADIPEQPTVAEATLEVTFSYVRSLDGMRAVAVLAVVLFHAALVVPSFQHFFQNGFLGVDIFFVLSGFLITSIMLKEFDKTGDINFKNFYARRFLRLMPAYWLHLGVLFLFSYQLFTKAAADQLHSNGNFLYAFLYLTNWHRALNGSEVTGLLSHTWSLAIEEQFYLIWAGLLFLMLKRLNRKAIVATTICIILGTAMLRAWQYRGNESVDLLYHSFSSRMDALLVGCLVGMLAAWRMLPKSISKGKWFDLVSLTALLLLVGIFFNLGDSYRSAFLYLGGFTIFAVCVGVLIVWLVENSATAVHRLLETGPMVWLGKTSYGIYLWHCAAIAFVAIYPWPPFVKLSVAVALTLCVTAVSYYLIEGPFLRLKKRFAG